MLAERSVLPGLELPVMSWVIAVWFVLAVAGLGTALVRMHRSRES